MGWGGVGGVWEVLGWSVCCCGCAVAGMWLVVAGLWLVTAPTKTSSLNIALSRCTGTFLEIRPCRARPGRAKPSQAGPGRRLGPAPGQLLELASFRKTVDSFTRNAHFRAGPPKLIVSSTRNDHFQNSIHTSALDDLSPDNPTAPHIFPSGTKRHASAAKCVAISTMKKNNNGHVLSKRNTFIRNLSLSLIHI